MAGAEAKIGPALAGLRLLGVIAAFSPAPALAGAWIVPDDGQAILTSAGGVRGGFGYVETSAYVEAPVSHDLSFVVAPWVENAVTDENGWRAEATLGVKHAVLRTPTAAMAVEASALWVSNPPDHCGEGGAEVRWLGGVNLGRNAFVNVEAAERTLQGGCTDGRVDLTFGERPARNWLALVEVFTDSPDWGDQSIKAQLSLVRFDRKGRGIQLGVREAVGDGRSGAEVVLALWSPARS